MVAAQGERTSELRAQEAWARMVLVQLDELADLRRAVSEAQLVSGVTCGPAEPAPRVLRVLPGPRLDGVLARLRQLAVEDQGPRVRIEAQRALARIESIAPGPQLGAATSAEAAAPQFDALGWTSARATVSALATLLDSDGDASDALDVLQQLRSLELGHPARIEGARRVEAALAASSAPTVLLAAGFVGAASSHPVDGRLVKALVERSRADSDRAQAARLALGMCAGRAGTGGEALVEIARATLSAGLADSDPARRRAAWLGAALLERGRAVAGEVHATHLALRVELREHFDRSTAPLDVAASGLALALLGDPTDRQRLRERLASGGDAPIGWLGLAAAVLGDREAIGELSELGAKGEQPTMLASAAQRLDLALALSLLGDKQVVVEWASPLYDASSRAVPELARGLAALGDVRAVDPLLSALGREDLDDNARVALVRALGAVCDPRAVERRLSRYFSGK